MTLNNGASKPKKNPAAISWEAEDLKLPAPVRLLGSSRVAGWTSILVRKIEQPGDFEEFDAPTFAEQTITVCLAGESEMGSFSNGAWKNIILQPGVGGMTPAGKMDRLRFKPRIAAPIVAAQIHIPQFYFASAAEEFRRIGTRFRDEPLNEHGFCDPLIHQTALSLLGAMQAGAPNLYAESAAQFLATHLLSQRRRMAETVDEKRSSGNISDRRLARVLEFMATHYARDLSIDELSREAGISRFHFIHLFKKKFGSTPHRHLIELRMKAAARLLTTTDLSLKEIGVRCGYRNTAHLPVVFQKYFGQTPTEYRKKTQTG